DTYIHLQIASPPSCSVYYFYFFFFFQAEDGIRDRNVTGVQTCALPISLRRRPRDARALRRARDPRARGAHKKRHAGPGRAGASRSEERRVGKECRARGGPEHEKKKDNERGALRTPSGQNELCRH